MNVFINKYILRFLEFFFTVIFQVDKVTLDLTILQMIAVTLLDHMALVFLIF